MNTHSLDMHILKKREETRALAQDPMLNDPTPMLTSMDQMLRHHHDTFTDAPNAVIAALGNSFSWQAHVIQYFSEHPPNTDWRPTRATIIPYSSSTLKPDQNNGYIKRQRPKGTANRSTLAHILAHLPKAPFTLVDMIKSGAGLAGFLTLDPKINPTNTLVFEPHATTSVTQKHPLSQHAITHMPIPANQHSALELACDEGIRGSTQTKIYEPPPKPTNTTLLHVKKSHLIHVAQKYLKNVKKSI